MMKGFVWNIRRNMRVRPLRLPRPGLRRADIRTFVSRYALRVTLFALFGCGLVVGAMYSKSADDILLSRLDFLFATNLSDRMDMSTFEIFSSCMVSYLVFTLTVFLMGLSSWGYAALPFLSLFKGFSVGLSSTVVFLSYKAMGIGFYILVLLPGTTLFLLGFINYSAASFRLSWRYFRLTVATSDVGISPYIRQYMVSSLTALLFSLGAALTDMLLWVLFAHLFEF